MFSRFDEKARFEKVGLGLGVGTEFKGLGPRFLGLDSFHKSVTKAGTKLGELGPPFSCLRPF